MRETDLDIALYNRQESLKFISYDYAILLGVGGIGSWVAFNLGLSGQIKKTIYLVDPDKVEQSNLNRTPFRFCDIGTPKVAVLKYLILERRAVNIMTYEQKTTVPLMHELAKCTMGDEQPELTTEIDSRGIIIDCRDDVYTDFYPLPFKYYKIGYDGLSVTIDGNPRNTAVWGRANGYRVTPSFICPSQLAANLVVTDALTERNPDAWKLKDDTGNTAAFDVMGRFNKTVTFNCDEVLETLYRDGLTDEGQA